MYFRPVDYTFDKLDVKEVSGALNLGTTFGVRVAEKKKKSESSSTKPKIESEESRPKRTKQSDGFTTTGRTNAQNSSGSTTQTTNTQSRRTSSRSTTGDSQQISTDQSSTARVLVSEKSNQAQKMPNKKVDKAIKTRQTSLLEPQSKEQSTGRKYTSNQARQERIKIKEKKSKAKGSGQTLEQPQEMGVPIKEHRDMVKFSFHKRDLSEIKKGNMNQASKETQESHQEEHKTDRPFSYTKTGLNFKLK